jgi:RNA-directed DNA polymerase
VVTSGQADPDDLVVVPLPDIRDILGHVDLSTARPAIRVSPGYAQRSAVTPARRGSFTPALHITQRCSYGGVASPLLSNIYLTVFDQRMAEAGFALTRYADDWLLVCRSRSEAERALASARAVLEEDLGLRLHPDKTRIVHITRGFEFLGYKVGRGRGLRHKAGGPSLYALPTDRSIKRFKDKVRTATNRRNPKDLEGVLDELNPIIRGWGNYYRRAHVRRIYNRLNHWIVIRVWNHQHKHWRNAGWRDLPDRRLYGELGLVNLLQLIPSMENYYRQKGLVR